MKYSGPIPFSLPFFFSVLRWSYACSRVGFPSRTHWATFSHSASYSPSFESHSSFQCPRCMPPQAIAAAQTLATCTLLSAASAKTSLRHGSSFGTFAASDSEWTSVNNAPFFMPGSSGSRRSSRLCRNFSRGSGRNSIDGISAFDSLHVFIVLTSNLAVGVLSDGALTNQSWARFEQVLWPKILAAWHLHRATEHRDLDFFILFSSRVGVMGNPGQANHAAANAFLDQLAGHRRAMGLPGQAIAWGAWSEIGEAAEQKDRIERQRSALGGRWFTPQQGLKAMERLVRQDVTTCRWTGPSSKRRSRNALPFWKISSRRTRSPTTAARLLRPTWRPGCGKRRCRSAEVSWSRSCRGKCRPCSACLRRRTPRSGSSTSAWTRSWRWSSGTG